MSLGHRRQQDQEVSRSFPQGKRDIEKAQALEKATSKAYEKASSGVSSGSKRKPNVEHEGHVGVFDEPPLKRSRVDQI